MYKHICNLLANHLKQNEFKKWLAYKVFGMIKKYYRLIELKVLSLGFVYMLSYVINNLLIIGMVRSFYYTFEYEHGGTFFFFFVQTTLKMHINNLIN